jgi:predicted regulator of Ras-like GTPase activity (Roadblock/LC7/MglB family)
MTTTPTPTGKIKGSLQDVMPKLRNFVGAVKVTTPKGKGGILMEMGRPVASYLTHDGVLHKGKESLELLGKEPLAEFEVLRYDDEQFREAMLICDNRGLLLPEGKGAAGTTPPQAREAMPREGKPREEKPREEKNREEANLLSSMMKRFVAPKPPKQEAARDTPKTGPAEATLPAVSVAMPPAETPAPGLPVPRPPVQAEKAPASVEKKDAAPATDADLSAIIRRLRESKAEKGTPAPAGKAEETPVKPPVPVPEKASPAGAGAVREEKPTAPGEKGQAAATAPQGGKEAGVAGPVEPEGRVKVDLGQMMKRIKRLDITSIRKELEEGAPGGETAATGAASSTAPAMPAGEAAPAGPPPPVPGSGGTSDIDELKAFIKKLEVLEEPKEEAPSETGLLGRLGIKAPAGERAAPAPKREVPAPIPRKEKLQVEERPPEAPLAGEEKLPEMPPLEVPPVEKEAPKPAEPDRKAKIASLLRRSGLVRPPVEEQPREIIAPPPAEPKVTVMKVEAPAPAEEAGIPAPKLQRKKVEITLVPKKPEKPLREPPLIDEKALQKVLKQPGVIAVSTFFEGFAVQSAGRADFEQVAANAEDLFRAGKKIAREIDIGPLNQVILETGKGKLIIAPQGDLNIAIFTEPDANLGLIRVAIKGMQVEKD